MTRHPDLLVGLDRPDDAGVYRIAPGVTLVQTVDFFTPIVDDPTAWGAIAAANALSDIYAMGGSPRTALSIVGWPRDALPLAMLADVQRGSAAVLAEAGCTLIGGHSIDDAEPKFGLAVTGLVDPATMMTVGSARPGDRLVLTKPLGTGLISTAIKSDRASPEQVDAAIEVMTILNRGAAAAAVACGVRAATDVTGFGLIGHLAEIVRSSGAGARIDHRWVPLIPGVEDLAVAGVVSGGTGRNLAAAREYTRFHQLPDRWQIILCDAQTSGGLLLSVPPDRCDDLLAALGAAGTPSAALIGEVVDGSGIDVV